ncbi:hypothetical protein KSF_107040 [Reticulibacter mediterranei]|uniref:Uncharacterized protein n=1 Tax=Reticulibacter mediterranei TaxID=2778369 RepID=A0A8J3J4P4_9CHLR|nr:hypothetical protein [Reticulibacter mediterranei]GHP00657.1 hypothetical protein KSF_107040 [Reticulibacter mediterranei]
MPGEERTLWNPDARKRERPRREVTWKTALAHGDIQVIYEEDDLTAPNPCYPYPDPRLMHPQRYYLGMWNEGVFEPMQQLWYDFDVRRFLAGFERLEEESDNINPLCGLFRKQAIDQRPLFQRGYAAAFLAYERYIQQMDGCTTEEWSRGNRAGTTDKWFHDGYVNTGQKYPSCMERIERIQWVF